MNFDYVSDEMWKKLAIDFAKRWLSHDGLWFQAVEKEYGMDKAIELDIEAWKRQTKLEARRIMRLLDLEKGGGLDALETCLKYRMYAFLNEQRIVRRNEHILDFYMTSCRVQAARERRDMDYFPCKPVGLVEYGYFAKEVDERISTECIGCPPDETGPGWHCGWRFRLDTNI